MYLLIRKTLMALCFSLVCLTAHSETVSITVAEVEQALEAANNSDNALARLAADKINEALNARGFAFDMGELIVSGELEGDPRPCTGFWSPGGAYELALDGDTGLSLLFDNLAEPIVFSVTLIGDLEAQAQFQWRVGAKIFGKCIRLAKDTFTLSAQAEANITMTAVLNMNPVLNELSGAESAILFDPEIDLMGNVNYLDFDADISGLGGTVNFYSLIPVIGPFISDTTANLAIDLILQFVDVEGIAQDALDEVSQDVEIALQDDLDDWADETELSFPNISDESLAELATLTLAPGFSAIPVSAEYYQERRNELLYAFLVGDRNTVNDILIGAACAVSNALTVPNMPEVPIYSTNGGGCNAVDTRDMTEQGPFFTSANCSAGSSVDFAPLSYAAYCTESVEATPNTLLGNAANLTADQQKWRPAVATALDVSVNSVEDNSQPFFKRIKYKTIGNRLLGFVRDFDEIDSVCSGNDNLGDICGCNVNQCSLNPDISGCAECNACATGFEHHCRLVYTTPELGQGQFDVPVPRGTGTCELEMRVYKKDPAAQNLRPLLALHGGSWKHRGFGFFGLESIISHLTDEDYAVFVPFYRLTGDSDGNIECNGSNWQEITQDVATALQFVKNNGADYGALENVDVRVFGQSAGAHLATWLSVNYPDDVFAGWMAYPPSDAAHFIIENLTGDDIDPLVASGQAARALRDFLNADLDNIQLDSDAVIQNSFPAIIAANPALYPDMFITHGVSDTLVPVSQSTRLCNGFSGNVNNGPAPEFGGDPDIQEYQNAVACETDRTQVRLYAQAEHALEFCIPGLACAAGDEGSQGNIRSGIEDAIEFLGGTYLDQDGDLISDDQDNCVNVANPTQLDTDGDGIGNHCDTDLNGDCVTNVVDLGILRQSYFETVSPADLNGDGVVNVVDLGILRANFFGAPGPSGLPNSCN